MTQYNTTPSGTTTSAWQNMSESDRRLFRMLDKARAVINAVIYMAGVAAIGGALLLMR